MTQGMSTRDGLPLYDTSTYNALVVPEYMTIRDAPRSAQARTYAFSAT